MRLTSLRALVQQAEMEMRNRGEVVHTERWQGQDIQSNPHAKMVEVLHLQMQCPINSKVLAYLRVQINPNLPWADNHFDERVCGYPMNPGFQWKKWPWADSADTHREGNMFNHNYMERYWPKQAGRVLEDTESPADWIRKFNATKVSLAKTHVGIRGHYGDLSDVIRTLAQEPTTRQAYLPIWFPEDTNADNTGRKPCTLGYHFIMRNGRLDIRYDIRSCDLRRHFRDDVYMTVRLALYILEECKRLNPVGWDNVELGDFVMNITSLHMFISDYQSMFKKQPGGL